MDETCHHASFSNPVNPVAEVGAGGAGMAEPARPLPTSKTPQKRRLLALFFLTVFLSPLIEAWISEFQQLHVLLGLVTSLLAYLWCRYDAAELGRAVSRELSLMLGMLIIVGFPVYLRRIRRYSILKAVGVTFLWLAISLGFGAAGGVVSELVFGWDPI